MTNRSRSPAFPRWWSVAIAAVCLLPLARPQQPPVPLGPLGGSANGVLVHPVDPNVLLITKFGEGLLRSDDGGTTFQPHGSGLPAPTSIRALTRDAQDPLTVYLVVNDTLYRSDDFGANWAALGLTASGLKSVASPSSGNTLLAADGGNVHRSTDGGTSWSVVASASLVSMVTFAPSDPSRAYFGSIDGVFRSDDGGASFFVPGAFTSWSQALFVDPADADVVFAGTNSGAYKSTDGGVVFDPSSTGLPPNANAEFFLWDAAKNRLWLALLNGLWQSTNGGASWGAGNVGLTDPPPIPLAMDVGPTGDLWMVGEASGGGLWKAAGGNPPWMHLGFSEVLIIDVAVAGPGGARIASSYNGVFAGDPGETLSATAWQADIGTHTETIAIDPGNSDRWVTGGVGAFIDNAQIVVLSGGGTSVAKTYEAFGAGRVEHVAFAPHDPDLVLAGMFPGGFGNEAIIRSTDAGQTWADVPGTAGWATRAVAFDPFEPGRVLQLSDNNQWASSRDGGQSWTALQPAWPAGGPAVLLAFDPFAESVLYRGDAATGLWRSEDGGSSWAGLGTSLHADSDLELHPQIPDLLWVSDAGGTVWISGDRGTTRVAVFTTSGGPASGLALDPADGSLIIGTSAASAWELPGASPYVTIGAGTIGTDGFVPRHFATGGLPRPGNATWALEGDRLLGGTTAWLFLGFSEIAQPVAGGVFVSGPPWILQLPLFTGGLPAVGGSGSVSLMLGLPNDPLLVGLTVVTQLGVIDPGSPFGYDKVLSPGLRTTFMP